MAIFEAPAGHEAANYGSPYSHPYSNPESEEEWEVHEGHPYSNPYSNPESEEEWEVHEGHPYSNPELETEDEFGNILREISGISGEADGGVGNEREYELEDELSQYSHPYNNPEFEFEDEIGQILGALGLGEGEYEADQFFGKIRRAISRVARIAAPLARRLAPFAAKALAGMIPGVGAIAGPLAGKLVGALVREAEMEVAHMENQLLGMLSQNGEAEVPGVHEALMAELMAGQAATAESEAEAEAVLAATVPLTIRFMRAQRTMLPIMPTLIQANARLVSTLRRRGPGGRQLLRLLPAIHRNTIAILQRLARSQRLTTPAAVRAMSVATRRVMSSPQRTRRAIARNMAMQVRATRTIRPRGTLPLRPTPRRRQRATI